MTCLLGLFAAFGLTAEFAFAGQPPDLAPLKRWITRQAEVRSVQADFTQTRRFYALRDPLATSGHLWFSTPESFRWELGDPVKTLIVRKGETAYLIQPARKRAERLATSDLGQPGASNPLPMMSFPMAKSFEDFNRQFEVLAVVLTGSRCHVELQPRDPQAAKFLSGLALDFDVESGCLLSFEAKTRDGSSLRNDFNNVRFNAKIDPRVFDFDLTGYEVVDAKK